MVLTILLIVFLIIFSYLFIGRPPESQEITFGVNFSQKHAQNLELDWKEAYLALLDDLKVKNLKLITHWDLIEGERDRFYFDDLDWQVKEAKDRDVKIILVIHERIGSCYRMSLV